MRRKRTGIGIGIAATASAAAMSLTLTLALGGCGGPSDPEEGNGQGYVEMPGDGNSVSEPGGASEDENGVSEPGGVSESGSDVAESGSLSGTVSDREQPELKAVGFEYDRDSLTYAVHPAHRGRRTCGKGFSQFAAGYQDRLSGHRKHGQRHGAWRAPAAYHLPASIYRGVHKAAGIGTESEGGG